MSNFDQAKAELNVAAQVPNRDDSIYFTLRSIALSLLSLNERLDSIDDALRNTIGGNPR